MKNRFLTVVIYAISLLCSHISYAQEKSQPTAGPEFTVIADKGDQEAQPDTQIQRTEHEEKNPDTISPVDVSAQKIQIDNRAINVAEKANDWAMWQTIIGGMGLVFVVFTTIFAGGAWCASRRSANTAAKTLAEAKRSTRLEMQPYLSCVKVFIGEKTRVKGKEVQTLQKFTIKNNGKTPAYVTSLETSVIASLMTTDLWSKSKDLKGRRSQNWYIAPNEEQTIQVYTKYEFEKLTTEEAGNPAAGAANIRIKGRFSIFYTDEFIEDGKEIIAAFDYGTGDNLNFIEGFAEMLVGPTYATSRKPKTKGKHY